MSFKGSKSKRSSQFNLFQAATQLANLVHSLGIMQLETEEGTVDRESVTDRCGSDNIDQFTNVYRSFTLVSTVYTQYCYTYWFVLDFSNKRHDKTRKQFRY